MVFEAPPTEHHPVQTLTVGFQFSGQLESVGPPFAFINSGNRESLSIHDARLTPLTPGSPIKGLSRPHVVLRRPQIVFLYFTEEESRETIRTLQRSEVLVAYTPIAVCQGEFHMAQEANISDFLDVVQGTLIPITKARIFPLVELPAPFPLQADLLLIGCSQIEAYHPV